MRFEVGAFALTATLTAGCSAFQPVEKTATPGHPSPTIARIRERGELVVGLSGDQPPLNSTEKTGEGVGFEPDIAKLLADSLGFTLRLVTKPFNELLPALQAGEVDAVISGMTMTPERNLDVAFVGPYFVSGKSVLAKAKTIKAIDDTSDLDNPKMRLVVLAGSTSETFVKELLPKAQMIKIKGYEEGVQLILKDQADALVADFPYCVLQVLQHPEAKLVTLGEPFTYEPLGIAIRGDDPLFTNLVTNFLITMEGTGRLFDMKVRWFSDGPWLEEMEPERKARKRKPGEQSASLELRVDG